MAGKQRCPRDDVFLTVWRSHMLFPHQTRLERMGLVVIYRRGAWALQADSADGAVRYNQLSD